MKVSLLDDAREIALRRALPAGVRMYTGDDFAYPTLIRGDAHGHSDALLGIFDAIAPAAAEALGALDAGDAARYDELLAPTVPLSRHIFRAPTYSYKTGVVFLAFLNGHQAHFRMVGGMESARSVTHLAELFVLADRAGLLRRPGAGRRAHAHRARAGGRRAAMTPRLELARFSLNQITVEQLSLPEAIEACGRAGLTMIGPWRHKVAEMGVEAAARAIRDAGLRVSSLCRGGFFTAPDAFRPRAADADNRRAVEEAATLGTDVLVLVCGPPVGRDVDGARAQILAGIERLVPHAEDARRAARDRAAAPDDDLRALGDRHARARRTTSPSGSTRTASASASTPTTCGGTRACTRRSRARAGASSATTSPTGSCRRPTGSRAAA